MPDTDIAFAINIPIREEDTQIVIDSFMSAQPYGTQYSATVEDFAGNVIENPITPAMYVEDCIAYYIMDITKNYLISQAADQAVQIAKEEAKSAIENIRNFVNSNQ